MSRRLIFAISGLILLACAAALAIFPARWLMTLLPASWPVAIVDAKGTIWSGTITAAIGSPQYRRTIAEPLSWQISFADGPKLTLSHAWLDSPVRLTPTWNGVRITSHTLQLPVAAFAALDARIGAVSPGGDLSIAWPATFIGQSGAPPGTKLLDAKWRNAVSALTPIRPLGDYSLILTQNAQNGADLILSTQKGPLKLNGEGTLSRNSGLRFNGTAQADPASSADVQAALQDLLAAIGPRQNNQTALRFP
jgi:general secretion pathway protein N